MPKTQCDYTKQRGVYKCGRKFKSQIQVDGKQEYLGIFDTREEAANAYDIRALQFGRTEHLNYNTRGGGSFHQQDLSRVMSKRILGATLIGLTTKRQKLVHILVQLAEPYKHDSSVDNIQPENHDYNKIVKEAKEEEEEEGGEKRKRDMLQQEAEELLQQVDASHDRVRECLEVLLYES